MLQDITLKITPKMAELANGNEAKSFVGHLGTHFDVMNKEFPLAYTRTRGYIFDVSSIRDHDIEITDIDLTKVEKGMFVIFYTGFIEEVGYGNKTYFTAHPQLANTLIDALVTKEVTMIGIDCAGVRRGKEHTPMDQYLANKNIFVIENVCQLQSLVNKENIIVHTYPMSYEGMTGLPCRIIVEI